MHKKYKPLKRSPQSKNRTVKGRNRSKTEEVPVPRFNRELFSRHTMISDDE